MTQTPPATTSGESFTVFPAIDLRRGRVVRLAQGDPERQTVYGDDPEAVALRWLAAGPAWLHVVNLDGAFGEAGGPNQAALRAILSTGARVQFGGGLRTLDDVEQALGLGVRRVVLGTAAAEDPDFAGAAIDRFGAARVAVGIDVRGGRVRVRGWAEESTWAPVAFGRTLRAAGVTTVAYTNILRDGVGSGVDLESACRLAAETGLQVIASGGVKSLADVRGVRAAGLAGVIIGRALYENAFTLQEALAC